MNAYRSLALQTVIGGIIMYLVMFTMISSIDNFYNNLNMLYMTVMMVTPMVVLMILAMRNMFQSKTTNAALIVISVLLFLGSFAAIRTQAGIGDRAFLRSMIPHHSGAILMCRQAAISEPQLVRLCGEIIESQQREIDEMRDMLRVE